MAVMRQSVGEGRAVIEDEFVVFPVAGFWPIFNTALKNLLILPEFQVFLFYLDKIRIRVYVRVTIFIMHFLKLGPIRLHDCAAAWPERSGFIFTLKTVIIPYVFASLLSTSALAADLIYNETYSFPIKAPARRDSTPGQPQPSSYQGSGKVVVRDLPGNQETAREQDEPQPERQHKKRWSKKKKPPKKPQVKEAAKPPVPVKRPVIATAAPPPRKDDPPLIAKTPDGEKIFLKFPVAAGGAVFTFHDHLWLVFDKTRNLDNQALAASVKVSGYLKAAENLSSGQFLILRYALAQPAAASAEQNKTDWSISLSPPASKPAPAGVIPKFNEDKTLLLPGVKPSSELSITDPDSGDEIKVFTLSALLRLAPERKLVDYHLLATGQGVALRKISDTVSVTTSEAGLVISSSTELSSDAQETVSAQATKQDYTPLFDFAKWPELKAEQIRKARNEFRKRLAKANKEENMRIRLDILRLLFSNRFFSETISMAEDIKGEKPENAPPADLSFMEGVSSFMLGKKTETLENFKQLESILRQSGRESKELAYWLTVLDPAAPPIPENEADFANLSKALFANYPSWLMEEFILKDMEHKIKAGKFAVAEKSMTVMEQISHSQEALNYAGYLKGIIYEKTGKPAAARELWNAITQDKLDRRTRARAQFALIKLDLAEKKIDLKTAVKQMEALRAVWRGDEFEQELLKTLGENYIATGNYLAGLRAWRELISTFPTDTGNQEIAQKMKEGFLKFFTPENFAKAKPFDALAFHQEFRELSPTGPEGDEIAYRLVDALIKADLLDKAASLLTGHFKFRLQGHEKGIVGARVAVLRLMNRQPQEALDAIDASNGADYPPELKTTRSIISSQAYIDLGQYDKAISALEKAPADQAEPILAEIFWKRRNWAEVVKLLEPMVDKIDLSGVVKIKSPELNKELGKELKQPKTETPPKPFARRDQVMVLKLATSYVMLKNEQATEALALKFGEAMKTGEFSQAFAFLTSGRGISYRNLSGTLKLTEAESFISTYRKKIVEKGIKAAVPAPVPAVKTEKK